ncbi:hypothetical protein P691DRAFT_784932 [Macrolepiota fuliginosa MF-IS2]|uniref:Uncharacterized protein n=1 Tax=Macrolepiota fuliginosa MF-IS2 TaxID=1400762 RepID=A0A9P5XAB6_9AGAR|nr:hypothetical protein P691DRAFT_784932 [Macrolepiota fuliginosa MF-IS2]
MYHLYVSCEDVMYVTGHYDPLLHQTHGNVNVSVPYHIHLLHHGRAVKELSRSSDDSFPTLLDMNGGRGWDQDTVPDFSNQIALFVGLWVGLPVGQLADPPRLTSLGWVRFLTNPVEDSSPDPATGPNSPHVELFFKNITLMPNRETVSGNATLPMNPS